jgi:hypothetical protein
MRRRAHSARDAAAAIETMAVAATYNPHFGMMHYLYMIRVTLSIEI